jgi:hypothetical protein
VKPVVGIFHTREAAQRAVESLRAAGIPDSKHILLAPHASERQLQSVPVTETEQPGMGKAVGGVVGGVIGATTGMGLAEAAASLLIPGVGPVAAIGLAAAALLGAGGAVAGAAAGGKLEERLFRGLPKDEIYLYEDALRKGHSVLIAFAENDEQEEAARRALETARAESLDAARESWWVGLRPAEEAEYEEPGQFASIEPHFRRGFEAALRSDRRGKSWDAVADDLRREHGRIAGESVFRRGFERGRSWDESTRKEISATRR